MAQGKKVQDDVLSVLCVVGARPNFMKIAPIMRAMNRSDSGIKATLLHTGQHYDAAMKQSFFDQLGIPAPDIDLEVGSGSHTWQTAEIMQRFEPVLDELRPQRVLVVGDVNSTIACALVAAKKQIPVIHVEAGLRSRDRTMPEEINRILTDQISDQLFTTEREARDNLLAEGIADERIHFVGNVMIDTLHHNLESAVAAADTLATAGLEAQPEYGLVTLHRPSNVDHPEVLARLVDTLCNLSRQLPLIFPLHPRTRGQLEKHQLLSRLEAGRISLLPPQGYRQILGLMRDARLVLTDSGGIQEETTALGVACITLRDSTERPITVTEGTNVLVGSEPRAIEQAFHEVMQGRGKGGRIPELWDGQAADRIVRLIRESAVDLPQALAV